MKKINILLNIYILFIILFIFYTMFSYFLEPYIYNSSSNGRKISNYNNVEYIEGALNKYVTYYFNSNIDSIKRCTIKNKQKSDKEYAGVIKSISNKNINTVYIKSIAKKFNNVYIVSFYLNSDSQYCDESNLYKIIIKLKNFNGNFLVYYDGLIEKGE